ncbi:TPM domain-containing protein [Flavobacterium sp. MFBS3-15]|uniref:TPM domain-containing protein n=1 Tax=Flavobacterium sp. MFBS3-15 TaxID=2989816 RepID=UPI0022361EBC|nr:TPM domain-containing protein [Flavobacterium sp. MFBS3-15]MCW4469532.1 TPM domain-containing protein [Flavobacterium sp. MFBS3-15]
MRKAAYIITLLAVLLPAVVFAQFDIPQKPSLQTSVYDYAKVLAADEKSALEQKLVQYSDTTSTQIVVITIKSLKGESIGELTPKWAHEWGIGQADKDNGVLILLAEEERKIWISPGYGVDDRLTAGELGEMTRDVIIPEFKAGSYYNGLDKGTDAIFKMLTGKYKAEAKRPPNKKSSDDGPGGFIFIIIVIIILAAVFSRRGGGGGRGGRGFTGSTLGDILILSSLGRGGRSSGGWGGSSGGGGFGGGFGGGGFSGGGAGGSW